jgi:hypothetical protein
MLWQIISVEPGPSDIIVAAPVSLYTILQKNFREFHFHALGWIKATCLGGGGAEVAYLRACLYATRYQREGRGLEVRRAVGHLLGGWSQWGNRLPHEAW